MLKASLEMIAFIKQGNANKLETGLPFFEVQVGGQTSPVVARIAGVKKLQYDICGDTVNTGCRMESFGEVGQVNLSQTT